MDAGTGATVCGSVLQGQYAVDCHVLDVQQVPSRMNLQAAEWGDAPVEVLQEVMQCLPEKEIWNVRQVGKSWATAARRSARFGVNILTPRSSVRSKLRAINRLRTYPHVL